MKPAARRPRGRGSGLSLQGRQGQERREARGGSSSQAGGSPEWGGGAKTTAKEPSPGAQDRHVAQRGQVHGTTVCPHPELHKGAKVTNPPSIRLFACGPVSGDPAGLTVDVRLSLTGCRGVALHASSLQPPQLGSGAPQLSPSPSAELNPRKRMVERRGSRAAQSVACDSRLCLSSLLGLEIT